MKDSTRAPGPDRTAAACDYLSSPRCRFLLRRIDESERAIALSDLARDVADWERETPRAEGDDGTVGEVYLSLYHCQIPMLADASLVQYNRGRNTVERSDEFRVPNESGPTTRAALEAEIDRLVVRAHENGVDVHDRAYELRHTRPHLPDWEISIVPLSKP